MAFMCPGYGSNAGTVREAVETSRGAPLSFSSDARKEAKKRAGVLGAGGARSLSKDLPTVRRLVSACPSPRTVMRAHIGPGAASYRWGIVSIEYPSLEWNASHQLSSLSAAWTELRY